MADISAKDVAALRKITGAGMMDCKKALLENDGDIERAKDWLREKGIAGAAKRERSRRRPGRDRGARRRRRRRGRRAQLRDRLRRQGRRVQARRSSALAQLVVDEGDTDLGAKTDRRRDGRRLRQGPVGHARREDRARPRRPVRDDRRPARRLQAHPERAGHGRRARRARRRRPRRRRRPARSRTTSRCTSRARRRATSPATRCRPTTSSASATSTRRRPAKRASPSRRGRRSSRASSNGFFKTVALLEQSFVKDKKQTIGALVEGARRAMPPCARFARVKIGEE